MIHYQLSIMFKTKITKIAENIHHYQIFEADELLTFEQVIQYWKTNNEFITFYNSILAKADFEAFFWENPPINSQNLSINYEFVLVESKSLAKVKADKQPFLSYFQKSKENVISFENLGKNALLIVPSPIGTTNEFPHIATFVRNAQLGQIRNFWNKVGLELESRLNKNLLWLSTSGLGVYWLHIRLDNRPKYYTYKPYKIVSKP